MAHWLLKSEPSSWSWQQQVDAGAKGTFWNGVRNHSAKLHLMAMKVGEEAFFYHSNEGKEIVGIVTIIKPYLSRPDRRKRQVRHGRCARLKGAETSRHVRGDQGRAALEGHGARQ